MKGLMIGLVRKFYIAFAQERTAKVSGRNIGGHLMQCNPTIRPFCCQLCLQAGVSREIPGVHTVMDVAEVTPPNLKDERAHIIAITEIKLLSIDALYRNNISPNHSLVQTLPRR